MSENVSEWVDSWQDVQESDIAKVGELLRQGGLSIVDGSILNLFEERFASYMGCKYGVAFSNGTTAIHYALRAVGVGPGDEVLVCNYGFHAMAAAVLALGARVVICDCDAQAMTISPDDIRRLKTAKTKAVLVHNPWGVPADYSNIKDSAAGVPIVSDGSHAHGASYKKTPLGTWADLTAYSLGLTKLISGGELGCVVTDNLQYRDRLLIFGHVNRVPQALLSDEWQHNAVGLKSRPHPVGLMLALCQLARFEEKLKLMQVTAHRLEQYLGQLGLKPQVTSWDSQRVWWRIVSMAVTEQEATVVADILSGAGVPVERNHYCPLLQDQPIFSWPGYHDLLRRSDTPVCDGLMRRLVTIPAPVTLSERLLERIEKQIGI